MKKNILFIVNPIAGNSRKEGFPAFVEQVLDHHLFDYEICFTEGPGHASELTKKAVLDGKDLVVAVGIQKQRWELCQVAQETVSHVI